MGPLPVVITAPVGPLLGFYHPVEAAPSRGLGVVLCNPLGYEAMCAHRTYRHLAERLALHGFPALRFDYHGTGDSSGNADDPGRVSAWIESIDAAIDSLRQRAGIHEIALFGARFGATLAANVAAARGDIERVILWAPSASGKAYLRELRAFRMIKEPNAPPSPRLNGGEEAAGYHFAKTTVADLSAIDLLALEAKIAPRALVLARQDLPGPEPRIAKHLTQQGVDARLVPDPGYAQMMRDPQETVVPFATLDAIIDWLEETKYPESRAISSSVPKSTRNVLVTASPRGIAVREHPFRFGDGHRLIGIASEPPEGTPANDRPAILFLNVGANHRVGPNRMYVSLARDLASRGFLGFRFDVAGLGDSRVAPGAPENRLYSKDSVVDVKTAMTFVNNQFGARRFVLVGLCSGAYLAFHTCIEDSRVAGQVLLNPQTFEWREGDSLELSIRKSFLSTRYYARALFNPRVWRRAIRGEVHVRAVLGVLRERLVARAKGGVKRVSALSRGQNEPQTEIEQAFRAITQRGVESLLVFSFTDGGIDYIEKHLGRDVRKMRGIRNFRFEIIEGADHTFTPLDSQIVLHDLLVRHVTERFA